MHSGAGMSIRHRQTSGVREAGFSLLEALIATTVVAIGAGSLVQLLVLSSAATRGSRATTFVAALARQKVEQLHAATTLALSPPDTLTHDTSGYSECLDAGGAVLYAGESSGGCAAARRAGAYTRRWSIQAAGSDAANAIVLQVLVTAAVGGERSRVVSVMRQVGTR